MIPSKFTSRGGGTFSQGSEHTITCKGCGRWVKLSRRMAPGGWYADASIVPMCGRCLYRGPRNKKQRKLKPCRMNGLKINPRTQRRRQ